MKWVRFAILTIVFTLAQAAIFAQFHFKPDLLLILLVFFAIFSDPYEALVTSFVIGFASDIVGPSMGPHIISYTVMGAVLSNLVGAISFKRMPVQAVTIYVVGIVIEISVRLLLSIKGHGGIERQFGTILLTPLWSAMIGPFLFLPIMWIMQMGQKRRN